jgi:hypothetical protein
MTRKAVDGHRSDTIVVLKRSDQVILVGLGMEVYIRRFVYDDG